MQQQMPERVARSRLYRSGIALLGLASSIVAGVRLTWMDYHGYPEYPQVFGPFEHGVSVLDLLLNCGPDAPRYLDRSGHGSVDRDDAVPQRRLSA